MVSNKATSILITMLIMGYSTVVFAQEELDTPEFNLDEVVVSATRTEKENPRHSSQHQCYNRERSRRFTRS